MRTVLFAIISALALAAGASAGRAGPIPPGPGQQEVDLGRVSLAVYTYRPTGCADPALLVVFHGLNRNADKYRDYAQWLADKACMIVIAPLFDAKRFPSWAYQRGGVVRQRAVLPPAEWTVQYVPALIAWARREERRQMDAFIVGHSAGGQFASRVAAFMPTVAKRIVIANPSTHVFPPLETPAPFGFGGVYPRGQSEAELRRYLATPVTIFLGQDDTGDENLSDTPEAQQQGETRLERGRNVFTAGRALARQRGWPFNWRLVELSGVGHSARKMFSAPETLEALRP
jgi:pimeloyl-ACP methyl ester carboxylesterase